MVRKRIKKHYFQQQMNKLFRMEKVMLFIESGVVCGSIDDPCNECGVKLLCIL